MPIKVVGEMKRWELNSIKSKVGDVRESINFFKSFSWVGYEQDRDAVKQLMKDLDKFSTEMARLEIREQKKLNGLDYD